MCKKLCIAVGAVLVGLLVIGVSPRLKSIATDAVGKIRSWNEDVSPEQQLKQLHVEMDKIDKDIQHHVDKLAVVAEEVESQQKSLVKAKQDLTRQKEDVAAMAKALEVSSSQPVSYNGSTFSQSVMIRKLDAARTAYDRAKTELKAKEKILVQKTEMLDQSKARVKAMQDQKQELQVAVADLEARLETLKTKQVNRPIEVNDSKVNECNVLLEKARKRITIEEKKLELYDEMGVTHAEPVKEIRETKSKEDVLEATKKSLQDDEAETTASK